MSDTSIQKTRIYILTGIIIFLGFFVILRLFQLQILNSDEAKQDAERQYVSSTGAPFDRGLIYFSDKDGTTVAAATVESGFILAVNPNQVEDAEYIYQKISEVINLDKSDFIRKATKKNDPYEEILEKVDAETANKISEMKLKGVVLVRQKWRFYPGNTLAAHTLGFVSYRGGDVLAGTYGLEEKYNNVLTRNGSSLYVNFFAEIFANVQSSVFKNTTATGDIITTLEPTVQSELEVVINGIQRKWNSESVGGLVMDPHTGEILAMAGAPTFDLNNYRLEKDPSIYTNILSQGRYEMGSIIKPLVMAAAIDTGAVTPETTYNDTGSVIVQDRTISNFDKKGRGVVNMQDVISQSLNTGMVFAQQKMGKNAFREYMVDRYKLGEKTGIDLPGEVNGLVSGISGSNDVNFANAAFGQGIATTPINIVRGFSAIANGGYLVTPHITKTIREETGITKKIKYEKSSTPILKPESIAAINKMMVRAVDESYNRKLEHYTVAAKTGTAQMAKSGGQGYYSDRNMHSLIGYFPASNPRFVIYLFNIYPKEALYAIQTLGDPFFDMVQFLGSYYTISPDR